MTVLMASSMKCCTRFGLPEDFRIMAHMTGERVNATKPEMNTAPASVSANSLNKAPEMPGVKAIITLDGQNGKTLRYAGDEVAAVAATSPDIAEDAIRAIKVNYKVLPYVVTPGKAAEARS